MAPPSSPPPVATNFDSPEYDALQQQKTQFGTPEQQADQVAREFLEEIIHKFYLAIHEHEAHRRTIVSAVESCLATSLEVIEMQFPARDDNPVSVVSLEHNSWDQERPPDPCGLDSWLRSALPETVPAAASTSNRGDSWVMQQFLQKQPTLHRSTSARSNGSTNQGDGDGGGGSASGAGGYGERQRTVGYAPGVGAGGPTQGRGGSSNRSLQVNNSRRTVTKLDTRRQLTPEQEHLEEQLRQELQQRKTQEEMSRRLEQKDAEERSKLASLRKELKGKDYTYDHKGEVVILNEFDPDRTPLEALSGPGFKVAAPEEANRSVSPKRKGTMRSMSVRSAAAAAEAAAAVAARAALSPTEMRKERDRKLASDFKKMTPKTQPSAMETLMPAGGVTLRGAGGATKSGPLRPAPAGITREAYAKQVAKKAMQAHAEAGGGTYQPLTPLSIPPGGPLRARSARFSPVPVSVPAAALSGGGGAAVPAPGGGGGPRIVHSASTTAAALAAARAALQTERVERTAAVDPLAAYGDNHYDPFAGARARPRMVHPGGGGEALAVPSSPDINLSLTSAGDWGAAGNGRVYEAPPSLPHSKPTEKQLVETVGRGERLPRERAPLPTLAPPLSPLKLGATKHSDRLQFHSILAE